LSPYLGQVRRLKEAMATKFVVTTSDMDAMDIEQMEADDSFKPQDINLRDSIRISSVDKYD